MQGSSWGIGFAGAHPNRCRWRVPHPVELGPGHGHAVVVLEVAVAAVEQLLCQEHQVLLGQARLLCTSALNFMLSASHSCGHRTLSGTTAPCPEGEREARNLRSKQSRDLYPWAQAKNTRDWMELQTLVWLSLSVNSNFLGVCSKWNSGSILSSSHTAGKVTSCFLWGSVSELLDVSCSNGHEKEKTWPRSGSDTGNSKGVESTSLVL